MRTIIILLGLLGLTVIVMSYGNQQTEVATVASMCRHDWHKCADNSDLVNHYDGIIDARFRCQTAAAKLAKYGDPKFPGVWEGGSFGKFVPGNDFVTTKSVVFYEDNAQFQNMFGAMLHVSLRCVYDLERNQVKDVSDVPRF